MAGKDHDEHKFSCNDSDDGESVEGNQDNGEFVENPDAPQQNDGQAPDESSSNPNESGSRREENPFSFKKFLSQDATNYRPQTARRPNHSPESSLNESASPENQRLNFNANENNPNNAMNSNEMAVLPDFVQDHLVIEQCFLNGNSSAINIDTLNLHNLPDLNVEHRNDPRAEYRHEYRPDYRRFDGFRQRNEHPLCGGGLCNLPDFAVNTNDGIYRALERENEFYLQGGGGSTFNMRSAAQRASSMPGSNAPNRCSRMPSAPSGLYEIGPYDRIEPPSAALGRPLPFDLTVAAEDRNGPYRGMQSNETISKSLPDFLSDGPIQNDRLGENLQLGDLVNSLHDHDNQRISAESASERLDRNRFQRELDLMRRQLSDKNRKIHLLESEIEDMRSRARRELSTADYTMLLHLERNLKHAVERATHAESALVRMRQENDLLRSTLESLTREHATSMPGQAAEGACEGDRSRRIAEELRLTANAAESSLRSLLTGIDNLRMIASSVENINNSSDKTEDDAEDLNDEEAPSGPDP